MQTEGNLQNRSYNVLLLCFVALHVGVFGAPHNDIVLRPIQKGSAFDPYRLSERLESKYPNSLNNVNQEEQTTRRRTEDYVWWFATT